MVRPRYLALSTKVMLSAIVGLPSALALTAGHASAQWSTTYQRASLNAPHNGAFRERYESADRLFNAFDYAEALRYERLWGGSRARPSALEVQEFTRLTGELFVNPPRLPVAPGAVENDFAKLAPEAVAMIDWVQRLRRQSYDILADESAGADERDGRIAELVAYYRSRSALAVSTKPKSLDALDGQFYSLAFRRQYPKYNGLMWASRWLQVGLYEPLLAGNTAAERKRLSEATVTRFRQMLQNPPESMPYIMPMTPVIAPMFARRYPELAAVLDNAHMLEDVIADILVAREVPRSAKRQEILRAATVFRSDTAFATAYDSWLAMTATVGANNMGGLPIGFGDALPQPSVARGKSMAGVVPRSAAAAADAGMAGMQHGNMQPGQPGQNPEAMNVQGISREVMLAVYERMMADPVIRERIATDPVIRQLLGDSSAGRGQGMGGMNMPGMDHANMPGMATTGAANRETPAPMTEERRQAIEFAVRLLSDPAVEARVQSDPELRKLWSDPDVQRRLAEIRRSPQARPTPPPPTRRPSSPPARPTSPPPAHEHR